MGLFSFMKTHVALNSDPRQERLAGELMNYGHTPRSNDQIAEEILGYFDTQGWDAAECINRISHAHSLVWKLAGKGDRFNRSKEITYLVMAAVKHVQSMRDMARG